MSAPSLIITFSIIKIVNCTFELLTLTLLLYVILPDLFELYCLISDY